MISCKEPSAASSVSHYAIDYLEKYDYLKELKADEHHSSEAIRKALLKFERLYLLKESGSDDDGTIKAMIRPRCGTLGHVFYATAVHEIQHIFGLFHVYVSFEHLFRRTF